MKISIITAVYNGAATIADTLRSVAEQTHPDVEHIVIDGASKDSTLEIINANRGRVSKIVSERDSGVYDAMNKGLRLATGEVVALLNADDVYSGPETLSKIAARFADPQVDICYGDIVYVKREQTDQVVRYWRPGKFELHRLSEGWYPSHPSFFARRSMYERLGLFSPEFPLAGDVELMFRFFKEARATAYVPEILAKMRLGGISNAKFSTIYLQNVAIRRALRHNNIRPENLVTYSVRKIASRAGQFLVNPK